MDRLEKAQANLANKDVEASIENDTIYIHVAETMLELADSEIDYQAKEHSE